MNSVLIQTFSGCRFSLTTLKSTSLSVGSSLHAPISAVHMQHFLSLHPLQQRRGCISTVLHCPWCLARRLSFSSNRRNRMHYCNIVDVDAPRLHTLPRSKRDPVCSQPNESAELFDILYVCVSVCVNVCVLISLSLSLRLYRSVCLSVCESVYVLCVCVSVSVQVLASLCVFLFACLCVCLCVCMCLYQCESLFASCCAPLCVCECM